MSHPYKDESPHIGCARQDCAQDIQRSNTLLAGTSVYSKLLLPPSKDESSHIGRARQDCAQDIQRFRSPVGRYGHVQQAAAAVHAGVQHALGVAVGGRVWQEVQSWAFCLIKYYLRVQPWDEYHIPSLWLQKGGKLLRRGCP